MKSWFGHLLLKSSNETCSCTSCIDDLDSPSLKRLLAQESKIDKLFKVNQMPLIEKLIKTRALYEDIRNQLLSSSISSKSDSKTKQSISLKLALAKAKRTGNIFELVDSLDKDDVSGWKKISECCSCCNCHSKAHMNKRSRKGRKHAQSGGHAASKSSVLSKSGTGEELRLGKSFKTKHIKSDPCTCACESYVLKELIKLQSRVALQKIQPEQPTVIKQPDIQDKYYSIIKDHYKSMSGNNEKDKDHHHKLKRTNIRLSPYTDDMGEGGGKAVDNVSSDIKKNKSTEQFRLAHPYNMDNYNTEIQKHKDGLNKDSHQKKLAMKFRDQGKVNRKLPTNKSELKQKVTSRPKRSKSVLKLKTVSSSTSTSLQKERGTLKTGIKNKKFRFRKTSRIKAVPNSNINIRKTLKGEETLIGKYPKSKMKEMTTPLITNKDLAIVDEYSKGKAKKNVSPLTSKEERAVAGRNHKIKVKDTTGPLISNEESDTVIDYPKDHAKEMTSSLNAKRKHTTEFYKSKVKETTSPSISREKSLDKFVEIRKPENKIITKPEVTKKPPIKQSKPIKKPKVIKKPKPMKKPEPIKKSEPIKIPVKSISTNTIAKKVSRKNVDTNTFETHVKKSSLSLPPPEIPRPREEIPRENKNAMFVKKNRYVGRYNLKRCFSALKLKVKDTKSRINKNIKSKLTKPRNTRSVQTVILTPANTKSINTVECECPELKITKKSKIMIPSPLSNTRSHVSTPSTDSEEKRNLKEGQRLKYQKGLVSQTANHVIICKCPKQNEASEFHPEFKNIHSKDKSNTSKENFKIDDNNKRLKHDISKNNNATGKSKLKITKHSLRNCACSFQFGKFEKKNRLPGKASKGQSTAHYQKSKSTSGFKVRSLQFPRLKKKSLVTSHRSEATVHIVNDIIVKDLPDSSLQQVRPSFAIKFSSTPFPLKKSSKREKGINTHPLQEHTLKKNKRSSILLGNNHGKRSSLGSQMKPSLLLVLPNNDKHKSSHSKNYVLVVDNKYKSLKNVTKSIKTQYMRQLKPCDCECFEKNSMRNKRRSSKKSGMYTQKARMISKSSDTRKLETQCKCKDFYKESEPKQMFSASQRLKESLQNSSESYLEKCGLRINSNFSFNIEFSKEVPTVNDINKIRRPKNKADNMSTYLNEQKYQYHCFQVPYSTTKIKPILKKCSCTLTLKDNEGSRSSLSFTAVGSQVNSFNTFAIYQNKLNSSEIILLHKNNTDSSHKGSHTANFNKETLSKIKLWQNSKQEQSSSVFSISAIAYTSEKTYVEKSKCQLLHSTSTKFESEFRYEVKHLEPSRSLINIISLEQYKQKYTRENTLNAPKIVKQAFNHGQLTGIQPLLKKCYCTMNIHVANPTRKQYHHKLKDYECEPGICVPYECDPYECQKLIMKRLMRKVSRMSGTDRRFRHSSSSPSRTSSSRSRRLQSSSGYRNAGANARHKGIKYQMLPRSPKPQKHALRVGSVFSFDIEFSKNTTNPRPHQNSRVSEMDRMPKYRNERGTRYSSPKRHNRESQSMMSQLRNKASSVSPVLQRCFCTLKLQKKGKQQKLRELEVMNQGTATPVKFSSTTEKPILRTVKTGQNTKIKKRPELLPYECEPNICVPGECDPYACLELIKKRKKRTREHGTESMAGNLSSSSSMTSGTNNTKNKGLQMRHVRGGSVRTRGNAVTSKPSQMTLKDASTPRQAVRIGSSFNFSIEFFKDNAGGPQVHEEWSPALGSGDRSYISRVSKNGRTHRYMRDSYTQGSGRSSRDIDSQFSLLSRSQSTLTSSGLRRCFCTLKLQEVGQKPSITESMLKRCMCILKTYSSAKKPNDQQASKPKKQKEKNVVPLTETNVVHTQTRRRYSFLKPYECEPGICVPGLCDPYECEKLIRKRNLKEKNIGTTRPRTRSASSSYKSSKTLKARMTQSTLKYGNTLKYPNGNRKHRYSKETFAREPKSQALSGRQATRIGSSFSFNIEFYKDNNISDHDQVQQEIAFSHKRGHPTSYRTSRIQNRARTSDMGNNTTGKSLHTRKSQMDPIRTKNKAFGPMLKRCFCTLKLNKKKPPSKHFKKKKSVFRGPPRKQVKINKSKQPKAPSKRIMETKSIQQGTVTKNVPTHQTPKTANRKHRSIPYKLLPYECEPGVCVPGECDPYECARRIKKRVLHRASSTVKTRHRARSNMIRPHRKYRDSNAQSTFSTYDAATGGTRPTATGVHRPKYGNTAFETPLRPAVKIGSKISFDMEFYKDGSSKDIIVNSRQLQRYSPYDKPRRTSSRSTGWQTLSSRNKGGQYTKAVRDIDSQSVAGKMRSTMTNVGPYLKRCFCTAQLDKSKKAVWPNTKVVAYRATVAKAPIAKPSITKTPVANKPAAKSKKSGEATKKDAINGTKSKQSRKKPKIKFEPSECEPDFCIPGQCDPYKCVKRIKKRNKSKGSRCECPITYKDTIGTPPGQEVVCFGSNLRFNIEFFKDDSPGDLGDYVTTETKRRTISTSSSSRLQDGYTQSDCIKYNCKASCARLKKCFCTLKLQKKGKQKPAVVEGEPIMKSMGTRTAAQKKKDLIVTREIGTKTKNYSNLMPYECQPGVCIPGLCNPYDCEKRIQLRHMKTFGTRASILTLKEQGTKAMKVNRRPSTNTLYRAKPSPHQSVRLGSNMSFRMEFYKESSDNLHDKEMVRKHRISQAIASTESKTSGKGSLLKRCFCTLTLQKAELKKSSPKPKKVKPGKAKPKKVKPEKAKPKKVKPEKVKPEKVKPEKVKPEKAKPKKVKPEKAKPKKVKPEKVKPEKVKPEKAKPKKVKPEKVKPEKVQTQDKATATKKKNKQSVVASRPIPTYQNLDPYECEPYVCIPGQCDPYECLEKIKKRGVRRTSRTTGTRMNRSSRISVMTDQDKLSRKVERIVEEPRYKFLSERGKQTVRITSNFSFKIEFIKQMSPEMLGERAEEVSKLKNICQAQNLCTECKKVGTDKRYKIMSQDSQSEVTRTENKSSAVAVLQRCFCTAKLHNGRLGRTQHPKSVIVGRVEEVRVRPIFRPTEYWVQYLFQQPCTYRITENTTIQENKNSNKSSAIEKAVINNNLRNLETIISYTTSKFNNFESRTSIDGKINKARCRCNFMFCPEHRRIDMNRKRTSNYNKPRGSFIRCSRKFFQNKWLDGEESVSTVSVPGQNKTIRKLKEVTTDATKFTKILCHWKHLFSNNQNKQNGNNSKCNVHNKKVNQSLQLCPNVEEIEVHKPHPKYIFPKHHAASNCHEHSKNFVKLICPRCQFVILHCAPTKKPRIIRRKQNIKERNFKDLITLFKVPKHKGLKDQIVFQTCTHCGKINKTKIKGTSLKVKKGCRCVRSAKKGKRVIVGVTKKTSIVKPGKIKPCLFRRTVDRSEVVKCIKRCNNKEQKPKRKMYVYETGIESQKCRTIRNKWYKKLQKNNDSSIVFNKQGVQLCENVSKSEDFKENWKLKEKKSTKKLPETYKKISDLFQVSESAMDISQLKMPRAKYNISDAIKRTYQNIRKYLGDPMRVWKKSKNADCEGGARVQSSKRYNLRSQIMSSSKLGLETLGPRTCNIRCKYSVKRGLLRPQKKVDRSLNPGFSWWLLTLSPRKKPWVTMYKCARICPSCFGLLRVWRRMTDVLLLLLAGVLWCPCAATIELCKVMMSFCVCYR